MASSENSVDELVDSLAYVLARSLPLLRRPAAKPNHIPGDEEYRAIAERQVAHLKRSGVEKVIRRVPGSHSWPSRDSLENPDEALKLRRPPSAGGLTIVAKNERKDG